MQDGESARAVQLMLRGDDDGVKESSVSSCIQGISQRHGGAELDDVHRQAQVVHTTSDHLTVIPSSNIHQHTIKIS